MAYQHMTNEQKKERIRQRVRVQVDQSNYEFIPEKKDPDYYDNDVYQRVAIYVRVSTDDPRQTTSYELQKKYYEEFVVRHPKWKLVGIYADEGISGTSLKHRDEFNKMISDCKDGQIENSPLTLIQTHVTLGWSQKVSNLKPWSQTKKRHPAIAA